MKGSSNDYGYCIVFLGIFKCMFCLGYVQVKYMTMWSMWSDWFDERNSKACKEVYINEMMLMCKVFWHVRTHSHLNECMKLCWINRGVMRWTLFVSLDEVFSSNPITSHLISKIGWRMNSHGKLRCDVH